MWISATPLITHQAFLYVVNPSCSICLRTLEDRQTELGLLKKETMQNSTPESETTCMMTCSKPIILNAITQLGNSQKSQPSHLHLMVKIPQPCRHLHSNSVNETPTESHNVDTLLAKEVNEDHYRPIRQFISPRKYPCKRRVIIDLSSLHGSYILSINLSFPVLISPCNVQQSNHAITLISLATQRERELGCQKSTSPAFKVFPIHPGKFLFFTFGPRIVYSPHSSPSIFSHNFQPAP